MNETNQELTFDEINKIAYASESLLKKQLKKIEKLILIS